MNVETVIDSEYLRSLESQIVRTQIERDEAKAHAKRLRKCYDEEYQHVLDAKILKCELAECKEEIERLKEIIDELRKGS